MNRPSRFARFVRKPTRPNLEMSMTLFLCGARTLEGITAEWLVKRYGVKLAKAQEELADAKRRRAP